MKYFVAVLFVCAFLFLFSPRVSAATPTVMISEVQTTGCKEYQAANPEKCQTDDSKQEFVELRNTTATDVDVSGWKVEYLTASHDGISAPTRVLGELNGRLLASSRLTLSFIGYVSGADAYFGTASSSGYLAKSGGHVRIVNAEGAVVDLVSWGTGVVFSGWTHIAEVGSGISAQRLLPGDAGYSSDAFIFKLPSPEAGGLQSWECSGLVISEILPNPAGSDTGSEFIELYNPTPNAVRLNGCSIRLNDNDGNYTFKQGIMQPGEYKTLSDSDLGFSLPNTAGATVWLLGSNEEQGIVYPGNSSDNASWALIEGEWKTTVSPTPGAANVFTALLSTGGKGGGGTQTTLPCPAGKYRHPVTHRCRSKKVAATQTPCRAGYVRNPETRRCRSLTIRLAASQTPCKSGYTRNSVTNRCRSVAKMASARKACAPGQERNPETNRCRKIISHQSPTHKVEQLKQGGENTMGWWLAGTAGAGIASYGVYEWRREIGSLFARFKEKISGRP